MKLARVLIRFNEQYAKLDICIHGQWQTFKIPNKMPFLSEDYIDEVIKSFCDTLKNFDLVMSPGAMEEHISEAYTRYNQSKDPEEYVFFDMQTEN